MTIDEAVALTKEASLVIILADSAMAKANPETEKLLSCVSNSPLHCRAEKQIKTMEYVIGSLLSEMVPVSSFPEPTRIDHVSFSNSEFIRDFNKMPEALAVATIGDLGEIFYKTHKKNIQLPEYT